MQHSGKIGSSNSIRRPPDRTPTTLIQITDPETG